jgi:hypothetical protein
MNANEIYAGPGKQRSSASLRRPGSEERQAETVFRSE